MLIFYSIVNGGQYEVHGLGKKIIQGEISLKKDLKFHKDFRKPER